MKRKLMKEEIEKKSESIIIGYVIPDFTEEQAKQETFLHPLPVFTSEAGTYRKALVFPTMDLALAKIKERYGREQ
jgi:hypothetical protein